VGVALEVSLLLEHPELVGYRRGAGQPHLRADLAHARGIPANFDAVTDDIEHPLLARAQTGRVRGAVGKLGDLAY